MQLPHNMSVHSPGTNRKLLNWHYSYTYLQYVTQLSSNCNLSIVGVKCASQGLLLDVCVSFCVCVRVCVCEWVCVIILSLSAVPPVSPPQPEQYQQHQRQHVTQLYSSRLNPPLTHTDTHTHTHTHTQAHESILWKSTQPERRELITVLPASPRQQQQRRGDRRETKEVDVKGSMKNAVLQQIIKQEKKR